MAGPQEPRLDPQSATSQNAAADELAALINIDDAEKRAYLLDQLGGLASLSYTLQSIGAAGTPSSRVGAAHSVESACKRILSAFAITNRGFDLEAALATSPTTSILAFQIAQIVRPDRHYHSPLEDEESRDRITGVLKGVAILHDAARCAREQAEREQAAARDRPRRSKNIPLNEMAWHILRLYIELSDRRPTVTISAIKGTRGGPAVQFLDAALRWLGWAVKPSTAADLIDKLKTDDWLLKSLNDTIFKSKNS